MKSCEITTTKKIMGSGNLRSLRDLEKIGKKCGEKIPAAVRSKFPHSKFRWPFFVGGAAQDGSRWCSSDGADIYSWNDTPHDMRLKYVLKRHRTHLIDCRSFLCCGWLQQTSVSFKGPRYGIAECIYDGELDTLHQTYIDY